MLTDGATQCISSVDFLSCSDHPAIRPVLHLTVIAEDLHNDSDNPPCGPGTFCHPHSRPERSASGMASPGSGMNDEGYPVFFMYFSAT